MSQFSWEWIGCWDMVSVLKQGKSWARKTTGRLEGMLFCGSPRPWPRVPQIPRKSFFRFKVQGQSNKFEPKKSLPCSYPLVPFSMIYSLSETSSSRWRGHIWLAETLGCCTWSQENTLMFTGALPLVYYRVLISNLRSMLEAQFDSRVRATGHSYEKYNQWETVWSIRDLDRHCLENWTENVPLIHQWFHLVDRGMDWTSRQWKPRPHHSKCHRNYIFRKHYLPPQGNAF